MRVGWFPGTWGRPLGPRARGGRVLASCSLPPGAAEGLPPRSPSSLGCARGPPGRPGLAGGPKHPGDRARWRGKWCGWCFDAGHRVLPSRCRRRSGERWAGRGCWARAVWRPRASSGTQPWILSSRSRVRAWCRPRENCSRQFRARLLSRAAGLEPATPTPSDARGRGTCRCAPAGGARARLAVPRCFWGTDRLGSC